MLVKDTMCSHFLILFAQGKGTMETFWLNEHKDGTKAVYPGMPLDTDLDLSVV